MATRKPLFSDLAIPPGEHLEEVLEEKGMSKRELAQRMGRPETKLNDIYTGKKRITEDTALQLEQVLGVPASIWLGLESEYRLTLAREEERQRQEQQRGGAVQEGPSGEGCLPAGEGCLPEGLRGPLRGRQQHRQHDYAAREREDEVPAVQPGDHQPSPTQRRKHMSTPSSSLLKTLRHAPEQLTDEQFEYCVMEEPWTALECAVDRLSEDQFAWCVKQFPWAALECAVDRLSEDQFAWCVKQVPSVALAYASDRLSDEQFEYCVKRFPWSALKYAPEQLTDEQLDYCVREEPEAALRYAADRLSDEQLARCTV